MIKAVKVNKLKFILGVILLFLSSYIINMELVVPLFLLLMFIYLRLSRSGIDLKHCKPLYLLFLFVIQFCASHFLLVQGLPIYYIPFSIIPMLCTILFNQLQLSLLLTLASGVTVASLFHNDFSLGILFLISGVLSSLLVLGLRRRMSIISRGFIIGIAQAAALLFIDRFITNEPDRYLILVLNGIISSVIVVGILPVFEYLFKTVTNISLLELTDFNHPLLQRLIKDAPGTYHHSLVVGNLSETASCAVGANGLLSRIGAYYHDIGKLKTPEYFSENQLIKENKHDTLSPTMSKLVIMNHVREGVELARKYKLSSHLIDFILQHHGTSLVYYFYRRALETLEDDQEIKEEGFRYAGPKPNTKETAIVLLADSVEAAARAIKDPTHSKIEELVRKIINNKFIDGQLDECDLTLKDLERISTAFIRILSGIYHSRISYPEKTADE